MTLTFRDFVFRSHHHMPLKQGAAGLPHWHTYVIRFWFQNSPDQDKLSHDLQKRYAHLHGGNLNAALEGKSSDEELAEWFLSDVQAIAVCCKVTVINDFQRGAEVTA